MVTALVASAETSERDETLIVGTRFVGTTIGANIVVS